MRLSATRVVSGQWWLLRSIPFDLDTIIVMVARERCTAIAAQYPLVGVNEPVPLHVGRGRLGELRGEVGVLLRCKPALRTVVELKPDEGTSSSDLLRSWADDDEAAVELDGASERVPILRSTATTGTVAGDVEFGDADARIERVVFFVVNLGDLMARGEGMAVVDDEHGQHQGQGRLTLRAGEWIVELDSRAGLRGLLGELGAEGGYCVTHVGRLRRADGATFGPADVDDLLSGLHTLLTFAWGSWVTPTVPVGYDVAGAIVWRQWGDRISADWRKPLAWLDEHHADGLVDIADSFFAYWADPCWRTVLQRTVGTYVEANSSGGHRPAMLDTRLLLAGTALELLGWAILDAGCEDPDAVDSGDRADRRVRRLLKRAGIDPLLPAPLSALRGVARAEQWSDGPKAVCEARHRIAHPRRRAPGSDAVTVLGQRPMFEAWRLAIEYLELVLLHELGYKGSYARHLDLPRHVGTVEPVPWVMRPREADDGGA